MNERQLITERPDGSLRVQTVNEDEDMARQSFKDSCDINHILRGYNQTGIITHLNKAQAQFADVSEMTDYADALMVVREAEGLFMSLPAQVRKVFDHDPAKFLDAAHDPEKRDLLVQAGLLEAAVAPVEPVSVPVEVPPGEPSPEA